MVAVGVWALRLGVAAGLVAIVAVRLSSDTRRPAAGLVPLAVAAGALGIAVAALAEGFWSNDFSLAYVADHARRDVSTATRLSGLWGGMGGSLLVFSFGVAVAALVAAWRAPAVSRGLVAAVGGTVTASLAGFVVAFSDPFHRLEIPAADGAGLTPILEHPAMLYHPPLVYAGLTSLTAAFALTVAALRLGRLDRAWRGQVRRWLLVPWTLLAVGMLAGAHWAYVELGWGGYWAWDPVENTALLPWLAVTAALHGLPRTGRETERAPRPLPVAAMVGGAFLLALLGGLLTRSGATLSVHAFAEARSIGRAFATLLAVATVGFGALVVRYRQASRASPQSTPAVPQPANPHRKPAVRGVAGWSPTRQGALRAQQVLLSGALVIVLAGSVWPLLVEVSGGRGLTVDGSFFAAFCGPIAVVTLVVMAVGSSLGRLPSGTVALVPAIGAAVGLGLAVVDGWTGYFALSTAVAGGAAVAGAGVGLLRGQGTGRTVGSHLAHLGAATFLLGVAGTTTGATETVALTEGQSATVQGHTITNLGVGVVDERASDTDVVEAVVAVDGRTFRPQLVAHVRRNRLLAESALHSTLHEDVQVMLRDASDERAVLQVGIHPLQQLVWWGGLLIVVGGMVAYAGSGPGERPPVTRPGRRHGDDDVGRRARTPANPQAPVPAPERKLDVGAASDPSARA